ncbi:hypothetical protein BDZ97DRAFT_1905393 [Flammula alnicola]|nr:hypothetical protein BDZ97DRAFT_1905393 [Flammula alnicola]
MQCVGDRLYVFGGRHDDAELGSQWRRLSGSVLPEKASFLSPGPRVNACSWVGKDKNKIFVMYGDANRMGAQLARQAMLGHSRGKWTREKIVGNAPSPRTEMAAVYNPILDKVVTFGGYSPSAPTFHRQNNELFHYSYYADTFICDFNNPRSSSVDPQGRASSSRASAVDSIPSSWRQVLTRGFPTYRARAHLIVDPATGKTYLFSGYINTEYVPSRLKQFSRSFCDLWELRMDIPGGHFDGVDLEEEARTAKAGPWQRCFACGSAGPWKKCGGACRGRVFFCSPQCLKDGWREHKQNHNCRKLT